MLSKMLMRSSIRVAEWPPVWDRAVRVFRERLTCMGHFHGDNSYHE